MEDKNQSKFKSQSIILENREKLSVSGVEHVNSYDENTIWLETIKGNLKLKGNNLDINKLNLEDGNIIVRGKINSIEYSEKEDMGTKSIGFLGKMFK